MAQQIQVSSGDDKRETREEQLEGLIGRLKPTDGLKLRIPIAVYDTQKQQYVQLRDAYFVLEIPHQFSTAALVEGLVQRIGKALTAAASPDEVTVEEGPTEEQP